MALEFGSGDRALSPKEYSPLEIPGVNITKWRENPLSKLCKHTSAQKRVPDMQKGPYQYLSINSSSSLISSDVVFLRTVCLYCRSHPNPLQLRKGMISDCSALHGPSAMTYRRRQNAKFATAALITVLQLSSPGHAVGWSMPWRSGAKADGVVAQLVRWIYSCRSGSVRMYYNIIS